MAVAEWIKTCGINEIDVEDVIRFDHEGRSYALYRNAKGDYFATDGHCTHEKVHLAGGLVMGNLIECPKHNGRLDFTTGEAKRVPICEAIRTYPVKIEEGLLFIRVD
jgi:3-phenylpropionate/trans-cinnamate dioxygenase ferredoxin subunit